MTQTPEVPQPPQVQAGVPEGVQEIPQYPEIPAAFEKSTGVQTTQPQQQFTATVQDDQGQPLVQPTDPVQPLNVKTVTVAMNEAEILQTIEKPNPEESRTWLGHFWHRVVKRAIHFGWRVVTQMKGGVNAS